MSEIPSHLAADLADRYAIERELGAGGMATVYLAQDLKHNRKVALKVLRMEVAQTLGADRFLREIEIAAKLRHPHILPLYDSGTAGDAFYYVMPLAEGESLRDRLDREKQLPVPDALKISREVADALAYAHSQGVVHRDIKPENILLESGHAVVADFGIARAIGSAAGTTLTEAGMAIGTPTYMSPEQAAGESEVDGRSDVYSLACVTYEMLAGQPPFTGPTVESVVRQHLTTDPRSVETIRTAVPPRIAQAVTQALAKVPSDRHTTAAEFGAALETTEDRESMVRPAAARPRRAGAGLAAVAVILLAALGGWWVASRGGGGETLEIVQRDWVLVAAFDGSADITERQMAREFVRNGLDQSSMVMSVPDDDIRRGLALMERPDTTRVDATVARELAIRSAIRAVVTGQIDRVGNTYAVGLRVVDADSGTVILVEQAIAQTQDDLIPTVDATVHAIREGLGERRSAVRATRELQEVMTPSFDAYRKWYEAAEALRRGEQGQALELNREALAIDPEFAAARLAMLPLFMNFGARDSAHAAAEDALALPHRLTERQQLLAEANLLFVEGDLPASLGLQRQLWERYQSGNYGVVLAQLGRTEEALEVYRSDPAPFGHSAINLWNMSEATLELGLLQELDSLIPQLPDGWRAGFRGMLAAADGRFDDMEQMTQEQLAAWTPRNAAQRAGRGAWEARFDMLRGRVAAGAAAIGDYLDVADSVRQTVEEQRRRWMTDDLAIAEIEWMALAVGAGTEPGPSRLTEQDPTAVASLVRGISMGLAGDLDGAKDVRRRLATRLTDSWLERSVVGESVVVLEAVIAAGDGDWNTVREVLAPARDWNWPYRTFRGPKAGALAMQLLGEAYERTGALDSAGAVFNDLATPGWVYRMQGDANLAPALYSYAKFRHARVLTRLGRADEGRSAWIAFLDVFTDPDPEYQWMVDEANESLTRLAREQ
jgi:serine/threonine-protein kinase